MQAVENFSKLWKASCLWIFFAIKSLKDRGLERPKNRSNQVEKTHESGKPVQNLLRLDRCGPQELRRLRCGEGMGVPRGTSSDLDSSAFHVEHCIGSNSRLRALQPRRFICLDLAAKSQNPLFTARQHNRSRPGECRPRGVMKSGHVTLGRH